MPGCTLPVFSHTVSTSPPPNRHNTPRRGLEELCVQKESWRPSPAYSSSQKFQFVSENTGQEPARSRISLSSPINILTCTCTPLSSRCRCCIWRSSTTGTCSCTATPANTGACCSRGRSTLSHSHWCAASLSCCTPCRACPGSPLEGPPRSS